MPPSDYRRRPPLRTVSPNGLRVRDCMLRRWATDQAWGESDRQTGRKPYLWIRVNEWLEWWDTICNIIITSYVLEPESLIPAESAITGNTVSLTPWFLDEEVANFSKLVLIYVLPWSELRCSGIHGTRSLVWNKVFDVGIQHKKLKNYQWNITFSENFFYIIYYIFFWYFSIINTSYYYHICASNTFYITNLIYIFLRLHLLIKIFQPETYRNGNTCP